MKDVFDAAIKEIKKTTENLLYQQSLDTRIYVKKPGAKLLVREDGSG